MYSIRNKFFPILLLLCSSTVWIFSQEEEISQLLQWAPVEGASQYQVEIEQEGELLHSLTTSGNSIRISLFPGDYRFRVGVLNKFGKLSTYSEWSDLKIQRALVPQLLSAEGNDWFLGQEDYSLEIRARDIRQEARFYLAQENQTLELIFEDLGSESYTLRPVQPDQLQAGLWDLVVVNPSGKSDRIAPALTVRPYLVPELTSLSAQGFFYADILPEVRIFGRQIDPDASAEIEGPSTIRILEQEYVSGQEWRVQLDVSQAEQGFYSLTLTNPNGESDTLRRSLEIYDPRLLDQLDRSIPGAGEEVEVLSFHGGYQAAIPMGTLVEYLSPSFLGGYIAYRNILNNPAQQKVSVLRNTGMELRLDYNRFDYLYSDRFSMDNLSIGLNLFYASRFVSAVNFSLSLGGGYSFTSLNDYQGDKDGNSTDFFLDGSAGIHYRVKDRYFVELGCRYRYQFTLNRDVQTLLPTLGGGLWLK